MLSSFAGDESAVRLTDTEVGATPGSESGILEVFHAGAWGTVCRGDLGFLQVCPRCCYICCRSKP